LNRVTQEDINMGLLRTSEEQKNCYLRLLDDKMFMPRKRKKTEILLPQANEPLINYLTSQAYKDSFKTITVSSFEEQAEADYIFWGHLTPEQRIELHYYLITGFFPDVLKKSKKSFKIKIKSD
jgi:hypothetical protein